MQAVNLLHITAQVIKVYPLRHTINGLPIVSFVVEHNSEQIEVDVPRKVECRLYCIAIGDNATWRQLVVPGSLLELSGFLSQNVKLQLVLNIKQIVPT